MARRSVLQSVLQTWPARSGEGRDVAHGVHLEVVRDAVNAAHCTHGCEQTSDILREHRTVQRHEAVRSGHVDQLRYAHVVTNGGSYALGEPGIGDVLTLDSLPCLDHRALQP